MSKDQQSPRVPRGRSKPGLSADGLRISLTFQRGKVRLDSVEYLTLAELRQFRIAAQHVGVSAELLWKAILEQIGGAP